MPFADRIIGRRWCKRNQWYAAKGTVSAVGGSVDLSRVLFDVAPYRWPFDQTRESFNVPISSLYEYVGTGHSGEGGDVPTLVGVDNTGALISQCGSEAAGYQENSGAERAAGAVEPEARSISAGGSTVFFVARGAGYAGMRWRYCSGGKRGFARIGEPGAGAAVGDAVTVNIAGSTGCAVSDSCNVTKAVTFQGASTMVRRCSSRANSRWSLAVRMVRATCMSVGCRATREPRWLVRARSTRARVCPGSRSLCRVGVLKCRRGVGRCGWFARVLHSEGRAEWRERRSDRPTAGKDNLYVWEGPSSSHPQGRTAFVATLTSAFEYGEAQATPDGEQLVFTSPRT